LSFANFCAYACVANLVRDAVARALKEKLELEVTSENVEGRGRMRKLLNE
jgi:hypothetical protein